MLYLSELSTTLYMCSSLLHSRVSESYQFDSKSFSLAVLFILLIYLEVRVCVCWLGTFLLLSQMCLVMELIKSGRDKEESFPINF